MQILRMPHSRVASLQSLRQNLSSFCHRKVDKWNEVSPELSRVTQIIENITAIQQQQQPQQKPPRSRSSIEQHGANQQQRNILAFFSSLTPRKY
jgi:hypothetical protein